MLIGQFEIQEARDNSMVTALYQKGQVKLGFAMFSVDPLTNSKYCQCVAAISSVNDRGDWNVFWKTQPEYELNDERRTTNDERRTTNSFILTLRMTCKETEQVGGNYSTHPSNINDKSI